jgi:hypothetical protein
MFRSREIANVGNRPGAKYVSAQLLRVSFAHENSAIAPKRTATDVLGDLARSAVVVTDFINRV